MVATQNTAETDVFVKSADSIFQRKYVEHTTKVKERVKYHNVFDPEES